MFSSSPSAETKTIGEFTIDEQKTRLSEVRTVRDDYNTSYCIKSFPKTSTSEFKAHMRDVTRLCETPHPSVLRVIGKVKDGDAWAIQYEHFYTNLKDFVTQRREQKKHLTAAEALWVFRQLMAGLAVWYSPKIAHGTICPENILIARNGQNQLFFKIGKVREEDLISTAKPDQREDMFDLGMAFYQILTLDTSKDVTQIRAELENNESPVRKRYSQIGSALDLLLQMLEPNPAQRPVPKNAQIALAAIDLRDFEGTNSDPDACIVPAGSGDAIVKTAQQGQRESQFQLSLLLRERGHFAQCVAWAQKAAEQGHTGAQALVGHALLTGEGCSRDLDKAKQWLEKAIDGSQLEFRAKAQEDYAALLFEQGEYKEVATMAEQKRSLRPETLADLGFVLCSGNYGVPKDEKIGTSYIKQAAEQGCAAAKLYSGLMDFNAGQVDLHMREGDGRSVLAETFSILPGKLKHSFEFKESKKINSNTIQSKWNGKDVIFKSISSDGSMRDKLQDVVRLSLHYPQHPNLLPIDGFSGNLKIDNDTYPIVAVSPALKQGSMIDFFKKPENQGKAKQFLLPWALQIASALETLHLRDITHGDISASSILINDQQQVVLGFDSLRYNNESVEAKAADIRRDKNGKLNCHLPPESKNIHGGKNVYNFNADIFAFGLTLFEIATEGNNTLYNWSKDYNNQDIMHYLAKPEFQSDIEEKVSTCSLLPDELKQLILKCIQRDPAKQPTATQLVDALAKLNHVKAVHAQRNESEIPPEQIYKKAMAAKDHNPNFALALLRDAAACGHQAAQLEAAEMLYLGEQVSRDTSAAIRYCVMAAGTNNDQIYKMAIEMLGKKPKLTLLAFELLDSIAKDKHEEAKQALSSKERFTEFCTLVAKTTACDQDELFFRIIRTIGEIKPDFALALLLSRAESKHARAIQESVEWLWNSHKLNSENKLEAIKLYALFVEGDPTKQARLQQMQQQYEAEIKPLIPAPTASAVSTITSSTPPMPPAEYLRLAFQHFFGLDVLRNLELSRDFLVKASEGPTTDPNAQLARGILSLSTNPLDEKSPLRFFVPGDDFQPPFVELNPTVYRAQGRAFRCSIAGRIGVLLTLSKQCESADLLKRCAHSHPNVIGPIGITGGIRVLSSTGARDTLSTALLYAPVEAALANRSMIADPTTAISRLLPFLVGISQGLEHLHRSHVIHGNVSLDYMLVGKDRLGLIAVSPPGNFRATAPESLESNKFSSASDVFHFGLMIADMLTGGSYENAWMPLSGEVDPRTRLNRLRASASCNYADIRERIPQWVPAPLVDIMMRCLRTDPSQRPAMDAIMTELQTLRSTWAHAAAQAVGPRPAQFWMHTSHICLELTADDTWLRVGGLFECLYGPRIRDRMQQNYNPNTNRSKTIQGKQTPGVMHSKSYGTTTGPSSILAYPNLAEKTRKIIEYKSRFFSQTILSSWDGSEVLPRGDRHFPSWKRGAMLLDDKKLNAYVDRLDNPPQYQREHHWCTGEADKCHCEKEARPKNPGLLNNMPTDLLRHMMSFNEMKDYGALAPVSKITGQTSEENMLYWRNLIKEHGNQGQAYFPLESLKDKSKEKETKQDKHSFDPMIRRWAKIIATQQLYTRGYTDLQLELSDIQHIPDITREERAKLRTDAEEKFKNKKNACPCCDDHKPVEYSKYLNDQRTKAVGGVFMACSDCLTHKVWTSDEARLLWGFTDRQLEKIPFWRFSTSNRFLTEDLLEFRRLKLMKKRIANPKDQKEVELDVTKRFKKIHPNLWNRYPDLPEEIRNELVGVEPKHPALLRPQSTAKADNSAEIVNAQSSAAPKLDNLDGVADAQSSPPRAQIPAVDLTRIEETKAIAVSSAAMTTLPPTVSIAESKVPTVAVTETFPGVTSETGVKDESTLATKDKYLLFYKKEPPKAAKSRARDLELAANRESMNKPFC